MVASNHFNPAVFKELEHRALAWPYISYRRERGTCENKHIDIMIPNHKQFLDAIQEKKKVSLRFYSKADSGVIDLVCAPMDYGPGVGIPDGVNRYSLWDYTSNNGSHILSFLPEQILSLSVLGEVFDPAQIDARPPHWFIARDWGDAILVH
jgi:hypothetical protein